MSALPPIADIEPSPSTKTHFKCGRSPFRQAPLNKLHLSVVHSRSQINPRHYSHTVSFTRAGAIKVASLP